MKNHIYRIMRYSALLMVGALFLAACGDDDDNLPVEVISFNVTNVTFNSAVFNGEVLQGAPSERGVCWSTSDMPTLSDDHVAAGSGIGKYQVTIDGLSEGVTYYFRAYASNGGEVIYGMPVSFRTYDHGTPAIEVVSIASTDLTVINCNVMVVTTGGVPVQTRGICWSTTPDPTTELTTKAENSDAQASFVGTMTGLTPETTYYIRPYLVYEGGTIYGEETQATTGKVIRNNKVSNFATVDGGFTGTMFTDFNPAAVEVLEQGVVFGFEENPTIENGTVVKIDDIAPGTYSVSIPADQPKAYYHVRSFVHTKEYGVYYSDDATHNLPATYEFYLGDYELKYSTSTSTTKPNRTLAVSLVEGEEANTYYLEGINVDESIKIIVTFDEASTDLYLYGQIMDVTDEGHNFWWLPYGLNSAGSAYTSRTETYATISGDYSLVDGKIRFSMLNGGLWTGYNMIGFATRIYDGSTNKGSVNGQGGHAAYYYMQFTKK